MSPEGCYDTACATVFNYFEVFINIPNGFSPDRDGVNDDFKVEAKNLTSYKKKNFHTLSEKVFESGSPDKSWNGKLNNIGADLPAGVYYVLIT